jgi:hypothetical protein
VMSCIEFLTCIGAFVVISKLFETFKSPIQIIFGALRDFVEKKSLSERYGQWAGEKIGGGK